MGCPLPALWGWPSASAAPDTPLLSRVSGDNREATIAAMAKRIPLGRVAQPEDIARAIVFLMTNNYMTGSMLTVDGGFSLV